MIDAAGTRATSLRPCFLAARERAVLFLHSALLRIPSLWRTVTAALQLSGLENEILMTPVLSALHRCIAARARAACSENSSWTPRARSGREGNCELRARHTLSRVSSLNMIDSSQLPRGSKYVFSTSRASIFQSSGTSETRSHSIYRARIALLKFHYTHEKRAC